MQPAGQSPQPTSTVTRQPPSTASASHHEPWPMRSGFVRSMPSNSGLRPRTTAIAASSVVTEIGVVVGAPPSVAAGVPDGEADPHAATSSASARTRAERSAAVGRRCMDG